MTNDLGIHIPSFPSSLICRSSGVDKGTKDLADGEVDQVTSQVDSVLSIAHGSESTQEHLDGQRLGGKKPLPLHPTRRSRNRRRANSLSKILIIDEDAGLRQMMRLALEHCGYETAVAEDGPSGIERYGDGTEFDVVLLDQRASGIQGTDALRDLRKRNPQVKAILTTALGAQNQADRAMALGAAGLLRKPFTSDALRCAVKSTLDGEGSAPFTGFEHTTANGFQFELLTEIHDRHFGEAVCTYRVTAPSGDQASVKVVVPQFTMELVKAYADAETVPCQKRFWQAMGEEALADYLSRESKLPPGNSLRVEDLTPALRRWVDGVMTIQPEAN